MALKVATLQLTGLEQKRLGRCPERHGGSPGPSGLSGGPGRS